MPGRPCPDAWTTAVDPGGRRTDRSATEGIERTNGLLGSPSGRARIDPAVAFVARCIDLLDTAGIAGIVLPDGVLDGPVLRRALLGRSTLYGQVAVEGVISLPTATFAPSGTVAKTSVLFLRRSDTARRSVFLARASHVGHVMKSGAAVSDPEGDDLPEIVRGLKYCVGPRSRRSHRRSSPTATRLR